MLENTAGRQELVFAMAHELGNYLGAIRLQAHLLGLDGEQDPRRLAAASIDIDQLASRGAPLLSLLRPILSDVELVAGEASQVMTWWGLMEGLAAQIEAEGTRGIQVDFSPAPDRKAKAPAVDWLQTLLMALVGSMLDAAKPGETISLSLESRGRDMALVIEDDGAEEDLSAEAALRGRPLCVSIARHLLTPLSARVVVGRVEERTRLELVFPNLD